MEDPREEIEEWSFDRQLANLDVCIVRGSLEYAQVQIDKSKVPRVGNLASVRPDGVWRWMYCQINSFSSGGLRETKIRKVISLIDKYEVDGVTFCESGINWSVGPSSRDLKSLFDPHMEREVRTVSAHNIHGPRVSPFQQGGVSILLTHSLIQYARRHTTDFRNLGRWTSWTLAHNPDHRTRIVVAYSPGHFRAGPKTVYQQQMTYINRHHLSTTPYSLFVSDLVQQLTTWISSGDRILLFIDANEQITNGPIYFALSRINMREITHRYWEPGVVPHTHISGTKAIDGIFSTHDIEVTGLLELSFDESVGDHRTMIIETTTSSTIGRFQGNIVRPSSRRLTTKQPRVMEAYTNRLERQYRSHRIQERLSDLLSRTSESEKRAIDQHTTDQIHAIHNEMDEYKTNAEAMCRKIAKPSLPYSPTTSFWYDQIHAYRTLIRIKTGVAGPGTDISRAVRTAFRKRIPSPRLLSVAQCWDGIKAARLHQKNILEKTANGERKRYLSNQAISASRRGDTATEKAIHHRMKQEHDRNIWKRIKRATNTSTSRACMEVQVKRGQVTTSYTSKPDIENAIQHEIKSRFALGNSAPISRSLLGEDLKYLANSEIAFAIIDGSFQIPDDLDPATMLILREIGIMGKKVLAGEHFPQLTITGSDYIKYHKRLRESTSSSPSGFHHGHGKASAHSPVLADIYATQMNLIITSGTHPTRWGTALQVLLEKVAGVCLVEKLRSIQLYEADLNWFMKFIFNDSAMHSLQAIAYLPEEHYSKKQSTAEDACLDKTLTFDISRQTHNPMAIMSVDAAQCYDRVHHGLMSLVWLALIRDLPVVRILLSCLGDMKVYTRTGYGDSVTFFGGQEETPACGLGQGSKAAPASWVQLSSIFVKIYKRHGFGAKLNDPVTKAAIHSIGCLFVDDTDLYTFESGLRSALDVHRTAQQAITLWSSLLSASGGAIKTEKSFWCLIDYTCHNGEWTYAPTKLYPLTISLDGKEEVIAQRSVMDADKTLGVYHCPAGGHAKHLQTAREKVFDWLGQMKNGRLPPALIWQSYRKQLVKRLTYGLGTLTNSVEAAEMCLEEVDYTLLPLLNVNRHVRKGWRRLHQTFGGIGLLHLPTEQLICRLNILQQHYASSSTVGLKLSCSLHWLQIQLGHDDNPLLLDYDKWSFLTCRSWWVELWHSLHKSSITLTLRYKRHPKPRKNDMTIMGFLMDTNIPKCTMTNMNRCRNYLQVLFLSDICTADGKFIERRFLNTTPTPATSTLLFPNEQPSSQDWKVWRSTWHHLTSNTGRLKSPLGDWTSMPTAHWGWLFLPETSQIANVKTDITHIFERTTLSNTRSGDKFGYVHSTRQTVSGIPISVRITSVDGDDASISIKSGSGNTIPLASESTEVFWATLRSGGGEWMWNSFQFDNPEDSSVEWIVQAMTNNTSLWVTDGSYYSQRGPNTSAAAWIVTDTTTDRKMSCSFVEASPDASSYRAETLGLYSIHAFIRVLHDHFQMGQVSVEICCDNEVALKEAQGRKQRISAGRKCADVFRGIRKLTQNTQLIKWKYTWVKAHMDDILEWSELSREQQLNVMCDELAKRAAEDAINTNGKRHHPSEPTLLPHEHIAVYVNNYKQTTDPAESIRYSRSKQLARIFLTTEIGWSTQQFDLVDWDSLHKCLRSKPDGFKTWLAKQHSNFCATRLQMKRWYGADESSCPSCGAPDERAEHLCKCRCTDRRKLLIECTTDLVRWMSIGDNTHPDLITWVEQYILGQSKFPTVFDYPTSTLKNLIKEQNIIGWRNFMEGRISKQFLRVQFCHLIHANSRISAESWTKTFISKILHITHSQWIFRNFMLHGKTNGLLRLQEQEAILLHIEELSLSNKNDLPEESRFLLEFDLEQLRNADYDTQCYWTAAVSAARQATIGPQRRETHTTQATPQPSRTVVDKPMQSAPSRADQTRRSTRSQYRPSPALRYATEDSNRARKPD